MKDKCRNLCISLSLGLFFWLFDTLLDHFVFYRLPFWDLLILDVPAHEIYYRSMVMLILLIFGLITYYNQKKQDRIESALRFSENRFRRTADNISDGLTIIENDKVVYANDRACEIFGYHLEEFKKTDGSKFVAPEDIEKVQKNIREKKLQGKYPDEMKYWIVRKDGTRRYVHNRYSTRFENGVLVARYVLTSDITERKIAADALRNSEKQYHMVLDSLGDAIHVIDRDFSIVLVNKGLLRWHDKIGVESDMIGRNIFDVYDFLPESAKNEYENVFLTRKTIITRESNSIHGREIRTETRKIPIIENDRVTKIITVIRDITAHKTAEEKLRKREALLRATMQSLPFDFFVVDENGRYVLQNTACRENWGDILGKRPEDIASNEHCKKIWIDNNARAFAGETVDEEIICNIRGEQRYIHNITAPIYDNGKPSGILGINMDITERKRVERALLESEERFRLAFQTSPDSITISCVDDGTFVHVNDGFTKLSGYSEDEAIGKSSLDLNLWTDRGMRQKMGDRLKKEGFVENMEIDFRAKDGSIITALLSAKIINLNGVSHLLSVTRDIRELKRAEEAVRRSEERFRTVFETARDAIFIKNLDLRYVIANPSMERLFGIPVGDLIGKTDHELFDKKTTEHILEMDKKVLKGEIVDEEHVEPVGGEDKIFHVIKVPMRDARGQINGLCGIARDVTDTRHLQEFASRAQRLETAGRIAGQVAHDFNNLLGPLVAYPELIKDDLSKNSKVFKYVDAMERSARKIADINQQLLTLGRRAHYEQAPMCLNDIVRDVLMQIQPSDKKIEIITEMENELMNFMGGAAQIHRVVANLVVNAFDAMEDGGRLTIKTENYYIDESYGGYEHIPKGEYVKLTVSDTGNGIPSEIMNKVFDPFFTTKSADQHRGSGLGLSVVHAVMEDHHGFIDCKSEEGQGTSFYLYFPVTREEIKNNRDDKIYGGNETILVVDDDAQQRDVSTKLLEKLGYTVLTAKDGEDAIRQIKKNAIDLVLLDMIMSPGEDGAETYRKILEIRPGQKAIIMSGYSRTDRAKYALELGAFCFLKKPLTLKSLSRSIRKALGELKAECVSAQV